MRVYVQVLGKTTERCWKAMDGTYKVQGPDGEIVSLEDLLTCWKEKRYGPRVGSEERSVDPDRRDHPDQRGGAATSAAVPRTRSRSRRKGVL